MRRFVPELKLLFWIQHELFFPGGIRFESVEKTLSEERRKIDGERAGEKEDTNKQSTQTLTIRLTRLTNVDGCDNFFQATRHNHS